MMLGNIGKVAFVTVENSPLTLNKKSF